MLLHWDFFLKTGTNLYSPPYPTRETSRPTQPEPTLCAGWDEYLAKAGGANRYVA